MFKRTLAIALVALMVVASSALAEANVFGWEKPEKTISFSAFIAQDNWVELEEQKQGAAAMKQYLLDNFNVDYSYTTTDGTADEALNLMLASGDYPDVIRGAEIDVAQKFIDQGKAVELTPYLDKMPTLTKSLGNLISMYKTADGKLYYLPSEYGALMDLPDYSAHLRYDEWLEIGSPEIKTPDDWYNAIMAILEKHPTTPSGETRYSLSLYNQGSVNSWLTGYWGLRDGFKVASDNTLTYWAFTDEGKAMSQFFNKFWRSGTMDPDSFTNKWDDFRTKVGQERVVGLIGGWWIGYNAGHEVWSLTNPNWTENMRYFQVSFKAPGVETAYVTDKNLMGSTFTIITDKAKDVDGIVKWTDFLATEPGMALSSWGIPGPITSLKDSTKQFTIWTIDNPTTFAVDPTSKQQLVSETWDYNEEGLAGANLGQLTMSIYRGRWSDGENCSWLNQMWYSENKWKNIMFTNMTGTIHDGTALKAISSMSEDVAMAKQAVEDTWKQYWPLVVMAEDDASFDAAWTALQDALTSAGVQTWTDFRTQNFKDNLTKLGE